MLSRRDALPIASIVISSSSSTPQRHHHLHRHSYQVDDKEDELPVGKYKIDKSYGDRRYENGEIFYKEEGEDVFIDRGVDHDRRNFGIGKCEKKDVRP